MAGNNRQHRSLPILAQRIELEQTFTSRDRVRATPMPVAMRDPALQHMRGGGLDPAAWAAQPLLERFARKIEIGKECAAIEAGRALELRRLGRVGERQELLGIDGEVFRSKPDLVALDDQQVGRRSAKLLAQRQQALPQTLARLRVEAIAPQQGGNLLAACRPAGLHGEIGEQRPAPARGDPD